MMGHCRDCDGPTEACDGGGEQQVGVADKEDEDAASGEVAAQCPPMWGDLRATLAPFIPVSAVTVAVTPGRRSSATGAHGGPGVVRQYPWGDYLKLAVAPTTSGGDGHFHCASERYDVRWHAQRS